MTALRRRYGASPQHLLGTLAAFAITAYAMRQMFDARFARPVNLAVWLVGGALLHDFVVLPFYSVLDALARRGRSRAVPFINHIRVPAAMAGAMLLVYFPLILARTPETYRVDSGHGPPDYAGRWLLITAGLFVASALLYALRVRARGSAAPRRSRP